MTTRLRALCSGPRASASGTGKLLHYSSRAINLEFGSRVITLLNRSGILAPSSIVLESDAIERVDGAFINGDTLTTDLFSVVIENQVDLRLHAHEDADLVFAERALRGCLRQKERSIMNALLSVLGEEVVPPSSQLEAALLRDQTRCLREDGMAGIVSSLLGRGFGLTPSGDDFILGMISIMSLFGREVSELGRPVARYKNAFSRTLLVDGLDGYYPLPVLSVLHSLAKGTDADGPTASLLRMGHTSGYDVLAGMYYGAWKLSTA